MSEFIFVMKSFVLSVCLMLVLQVEIADTTIENHVFKWVHASSIGKHLTRVAEGGVLVVTNGFKYLTQFVSKTIGDNAQKATDTTKASRLNFEIKRPEHSSSNQDIN